MDLALIILIFLVGMIIGAALVWFFIHLPKLNEVSQGLEIKLKDAFGALSADALKSNNQAFLDLAKLQLETYQNQAKHDLETRQQAIDALIKPVAESLTSVNQRVVDLDKARAETHAALNEQVKNLMALQSNLQNETSNLINALRSPKVRGQWGELCLKNVIEMAGMLEHCDFTEQQTLQAGDRQQRPDVTIHLPGNKNVVVDSKMPFDAFMKAIQTNNDDQTRLHYFKEHARQVRERLSELSDKNYWKQLPNSPEFVILFLPTESLFSAALEHDPELIQVGWQRKVLMATPTTLIALLRAVAYGWSSEALSQNAAAISELGKELYGRVRIFADHFIQLRKGIENTVKSYNEAAGSLESRVLISSRKFNELSVSDGQEIKIVEPIEITPRAMSVPELNINR